MLDLVFELLISVRVEYRVAQLDSPTSRVELEFDSSSLESSFDRGLTESISSSSWVVSSHWHPYNRFNSWNERRYMVIIIENHLISDKQRYYFTGKYHLWLFQFEIPKGIVILLLVLDSIEVEQWIYLYLYWMFGIIMEMIYTYIQWIFNKCV